MRSSNCSRWNLRRGPRDLTEPEELVAYKTLQFDAPRSLYARIVPTLDLSFNHLALNKLSSRRLSVSLACEDCPGLEADRAVDLSRAFSREENAVLAVVRG